MSLLTFVTCRLRVKRPGKRRKAQIYVLEVVQCLEVDRGAGLAARVATDGTPLVMRPHRHFEQANSPSSESESGS